MPCMRLSYSLGSLLSIPQVSDCVDRLSQNEPDMIWIPETWGMECFSMLAGIAARTSRANIGSSIVNIYSRSPALVAMGAATVDMLSSGRLILGLGTSSMPIVRDLHGYPFKNPVSRMEEYIKIIRQAIAGDTINHTGRHFNLSGFKILFKPYRPRIPIYVAAINSRMVRLAWDTAEGVIFYLRPQEEMKKTIRHMQQGRKIDVACQIITAVSDDSEKAILRAKKTLSFYIAVGDVYRDFLAGHGYQKEVLNIHDEYVKSGLENIAEQVPDYMISDMTICGTPEEAKRQLLQFTQTGVDIPIIQFNPVGDVAESLEQTMKAFVDV